MLIPLQLAVELVKGHTLTIFQRKRAYSDLRVFADFSMSLNHNWSVQFRSRSVGELSAM